MPSINKDCLHRFLMADDTIRGAVIDGSQMVRKMRRRHALGILETLVLGHAYMGASLMSAGLKGQDRLCLQVDCSGPIKGLQVEANAAGEVRGYLKNTPIPIEKPLERFDLSPFYGAGFLSVTRTLAGAKRPFTGKVMMAHGSLAKDLADYYYTSEQIPTAFNLSVKFDNDGRVAGAGGLFLQAMPGADDEIMKAVEGHVLNLPSIGTVLSEGVAPEALVSQYFSAYAPQFIDRRPVGFTCHCTRDQIRNLLTMLPMDELADIQKNGPFPVNVRCHHCNTQYAFEKGHLDVIVAARFAAN